MPHRLLNAANPLTPHQQSGFVKFFRCTSHSIKRERNTLGTYRLLKCGICFVKGPKIGVAVKYTEHLDRVSFPSSTSCARSVVKTQDVGGMYQPSTSEATSALSPICYAP